MNEDYMILKRRLLEVEDLKRLNIFGIEYIEYQTTIDTGWYDLHVDNYKSFDIYSIADKNDNDTFIAICDSNDYSGADVIDYDLIDVIELSKNEGIHILNTIRMLGSYVDNLAKIKEYNEAVDSWMESEYGSLEYIEDDEADE